MEPKHLVYLATIIDKGSITAASEHLSIAQPTLTRAMATLEMQAGRQLFSRSRFGVQSTEIGEALAREGRAILRTMDTAREQISRYQLGIHKELRIATGPLIGMGVMTRVIDQMNLQNPDTALTITVLRPSEALEQLQEERLDVVVAPDPIGRELPGFIKHRLCRDEVSVFCGRSHPLTEVDQVSLEDLAASEWLSMGMATTFEKQVLEMLSSGGVKRVRSRVIFRNDSAILLYLLSQGRQLAALPRIPVVAIGNPNIVELDIRLGQPVPRDLYFWAREDIVESTACQQLQALVQAELDSVSKYM